MDPRLATVKEPLASAMDPRIGCCEGSEIEGWLLRRIQGWLLRRNRELADATEPRLAAALEPRLAAAMECLSVGGSRRICPTGAGEGSAGWYGGSRRKTPMATRLECPRGTPKDQADEEGEGLAKGDDGVPRKTPMAARTFGRG
jgi:hypothetical protein